MAEGLTQKKGFEQQAALDNIVRNIIALKKEALELLDSKQIIKNQYEFHDNMKLLKFANIIEQKRLT